jgi:hypothetical protein
MERFLNFVFEKLYHSLFIPSSIFLLLAHIVKQLGL